MNTTLKITSGIPLAGTTAAVGGAAAESQTPRRFVLPRGAMET